MKSAKDKKAYSFKEVYCSDDWIKQAERDFQLAKIAFDNSYYEWTAFACQQASEKAVKALLHLLGQRHRATFTEHSVRELLKLIPKDLYVFNDAKQLNPKAMEIDQHNQISRYPSITQQKQGFPGSHYTKEQGEKCIEIADYFITVCKQHVSRIKTCFDSLK